MKQFFLLFFLSTCILSAQNLVVAAGNSISINTGASININGLKLTPNAPFEIVGPNAIDRSSTALTSESGSSINGVLNATNVINNFAGTLAFFYDDSELNGLDESLLEIHIKDGSGIWKSYTGTHDMIANVITHTFSTAINFTEITTAHGGVSLSIENISNSNMCLYPNPTTSQVFIDYDGACEVKIYNIHGQLLLKTNDKIIDLSLLENTMYFLIIKDALNNTTNSYKIIKQ